jgi:oligopeptide/dipeptide ABC transporter ATP-binding protein
LTKPLLQVRDLKKYFPVRTGVFRRVSGWVKAVDGVNFEVHAGETLGLVGESGCGKTTVGRSVLRLIEPSGGEVLVDDKNIGDLRGAELRALRRDLQIIFQDPYSSLNPRMTVARIVGEGLVIHRLGSTSEREEKVKRTLERVGLAADCLHRYPHEFSGGQRQRIGIARALVLDPRFIVCDEAVSALDVSIQAQIVNLLADLQDELGMAYLFIAHDLAVVEHISDRVAVMYLGEIVETAPTRAIFDSPLHPYTKALLSAVPVPDPKAKRERVLLEGDVPSPLDPPGGCRFHPRCPVAIQGVCDKDTPKTIDIDGHQVACHVVEKELGSATP